MHASVTATRTANSETYHGTSYSARFECPSCGKSRRFNLNFLGRREVVCDGEKMVSGRPQKEMTWREAKAAGLL